MGALANRTTDPASEAERLTRKRRIEPLLDAAGWPRRKGKASAGFRTEEVETAHGPADYALWLGDRVVGIVEAKKLTIGPQNVLTQAGRYARGPAPNGFDLDGVRCPFLYATNSEVIWFHDVRHALNRSRQIQAFHTQGALKELFAPDAEAALEKLGGMPHDHPRLRPDQLEATAGVGKAIAARKRNLLVAMATGTGKTLTIVNQIYRLTKAGVARRVLLLVDRRRIGWPPQPSLARDSRRPSPPRPSAARSSRLRPRGLAKRSEKSPGMPAVPSEVS
jgi:type I restriction enzyme, R subunit